MPPGRAAVASTPWKEPSQQAVAPPPRWGLGAFVLVALTYLAVSAVLAGGLASGVGPVSAGSLAVAVVVPTAAAAGLAVLVTILRGNGRGRTCDCTGRGARSGWA